MGEPATPLPFRQPDPYGNKPRWNIGIDKKQVGLYVGLAIVAGFGLGLATSRFLSTPAPSNDRAARAEATRPDALPAAGSLGSYKVSRILRADTLELAGLGIVRLLGVESPEGKTPPQIYEAHAHNAAAFTQRSLEGQEVRVQFESVPLRDDAGGKAAYVYTRDGRLFNAEIIRAGHAFVKTSEQCQLIEQLRSAEREAMQAMRGVWGLADGSTAPPAVLADTPKDQSKKLKPLLP